MFQLFKNQLRIKQNHFKFTKVRRCIGAMSSQSNPLGLKNPKLYQPFGYINGEWISSEKTFEVDNPATGEVIAKVPDLGLEEARKAIDAAEVAFKTFRYTSGRERADILRKWFNLCMENIDDLAKILTLENGKTLTDSKGEVNYGAGFFEWFAEEAPRNYGDLIQPRNPSVKMITMKQPVGVCGILTPWNFPNAMITRKVGAALAAGCTVVVKPAHETPLSCAALAYLAELAGVPKGVFNVVPTMTHLQDYGREFCENPKIRKVSFTGSTRVGKILMSQSASTLKKLSFELGGNAPFIVFDDADVDNAVQQAINCKFRQLGQTCVCANRLYIHESIYEEFATKLAEKVSKFKIGNGLEEGVSQGCLIASRAADKVETHIKDAVSKGGKVIAGGKRRKDLGPAFFEPTIIRDGTGEMLVNTEETFGPLAVLIPFKSEEQVVELANNTEFGLASYIFSKNIERVFRVGEALETGMVGANTGLISDVSLPFGGVKESGFGREGSKYGLDEYCTIKTIVVANVGQPSRL